MQSESSQNTLRMSFDIFPLRMHFESFEHEQNIRAAVTRMDPNVWNALRMQSEFLECTSNIQEYTKKIHSDGIPAHSASSVTGVVHRN